MPRFRQFLRQVVAAVTRRTPAFEAPPAPIRIRLAEPDDMPPIELIEGEPLRYLGWSSSDRSIAEVTAFDPEGGLTIDAKRTGTVILTAETTEGPMPTEITVVPDRRTES